MRSRTPASMIAGRPAARPARRCWRSPRAFRRSALLDQVGDELQLADAFEIGDLGRKAPRDQSLEAGDQQLGNSAPHDGLLVEQIGLGLLGEARRDEARRARSRLPGHRRARCPRVPGCVLLDRPQRDHALALGVERAKRGARTFGATRKTSRSALGSTKPKRTDSPWLNPAPRLGAGAARFSVERAMDIVGCEHHHDVGRAHRVLEQSDL